ncbi:ABC transporter substrate-binding protein [Pseudoxanthobacter sp.]|uniref:ABC transporter substrate-binding protein n=1 Tax=Pseudoxanthobacter sp. TaxID=1925742 RepID=UPI002FDF76AD
MSGPERSNGPAPGAGAAGGAGPAGSPRVSRRALLAGGAALLASLRPVQAEAPAHGTAARAPYVIYMITYRGETEVEQGFRDYFAQRQIPVDLVVRDIGRDVSRVPGLIDEIRRLKPDLVYTWGTPVTLATVGRWDKPDPQKYITDIPVVFTMVAAPVAAGVVPSLASSGRNVTGAFHVVPLDAQMRAMQAYRPFDALGVLYSRSEPNSVALVAELQTVAEQMQFRLDARPFAANAAGQPVADGVPAMIADMKATGTDWLYLLPDTFLGTIYDITKPAAAAVRLPAFGAAELSIRSGGALAGLVCRYYSVGQLAASKAEAILTGGQPASDVPVETLKRFSLIINMPVAAELDLYPPLAMLNYAEVISG